jgi:thiamine pyrophosphate-dependent acetolactate synthase large subunit-like protein
MKCTSHAICRSSRDLGFTCYDKLSEVLGCHGEYVEKPGEIRPALDRANAAVQAGKPSVVNVITDPRARSPTARFSTYRAI